MENTMTNTETNETGENTMTRAIEPANGTITWQTKETKMFQLTVFHNDDSDLTLNETIQEFEDHGLTVVSKEFSHDWDEWTVVIQGTKENFFKWNDTINQGGPSWNEEEFMEELEEVEAA